MLDFNILEQNMKLDFPTKIRLALLLKEIGKSPLLNDPFLNSEEKAWIERISTPDGTLQESIAYELATEGLLSHHEDLQKLGGLVNWRHFETIVSRLFTHFGYHVLSPFRYHGLQGRREIDVLAFDSPYLFLIDCKHFSPRHSSLSQLKMAARKQYERVQELVDVFPTVISQLPFALERKHGKFQLFPLVVPWSGSQLFQEPESAAIIPSTYLPDLLRQIDEHVSYLNSISVEIR